MKFLYTFLLTASCFLCDALHAQDASPAGYKLSGIVQDAENNKPIASTSIGTDNKRSTGITAQDGSFTLTAAPGSKIYLSATGYSSMSYTINKNETGKIFLLSKSTTDLDNVTVTTALGITRAQKALGYAVQKLDENALSDARSNNWVASLSGKVAGLNLLSSGSGPLNSTRISLRGDASLNPDGNNALVVLDGVPLNSGGTTSGVANAYGAGSGNDVPVDFGNGIADINPDDIESITVLKGPGATALYGSRAANGALLITTKTGASKKNKGIGVTVNSNISFNTVLKWPDYQYEYGQGTGKALNAAGQPYYSYGNSADGNSTSGTSSAFGPKLNGQSYFQYDPILQGAGTVRTPWVPQKNNIKDFWRTGYTITNNISLEGGNEKGAARASVTHSKNEWIMPNTGYERITAQVSVNYKLSEKLKIASKINYTNKQSDNLPATGYNNQSIAYFMIFQNPNVDLNWYKDYWKRGLNQIEQVHPFSSFIDNPFLIANEMTNAITSNAVTGNLSATYEISKKLEVMLRTGINFNNEDREQRRPYSTANYLKGFYKQQSIFDYEMNTDALLSYKDKIGRNFMIGASAGGNILVHKYQRIDASVEGLVVPGIYKLSNGLGQVITTFTDANRQVQSLYGTASASYKNKYFLDITARNDWSSTLPVQNNSFFYPSVNTSFILSDIFTLPAKISYAKFRLSAAQVGNDTRPYQTSKYYGTSDFAGSASVDTRLFNANFKPEISTSYEAGLEMKFFNRRLSIDATVYNNTTKNQILDVPLDPTTGYSRAVLNAGKVRNQGVELIVTGNIISQKKFKWNATATWAKNQNRVLELAEGFSDRQDIGYGGNATLQARVGGTTGDIYGFGFMRAPDGQIIYTADGLPARPADIQYIGNAYAKWKAGLQNEFSYKAFRFSFLIDGQYGGIIYSQTHHKMTEQGKLAHTLRGREENYIIGDGVVMDNASGKYIPNTKKILPADYYADYYRRANVEANSFDASFLKLREARLEYNLPKNILGKSFLKQVTFALYGRDLLMITSFPIFDPETAALNGSTLLPGVEMGQLPSSRTMGVNITVKF